MIWGNVKNGSDETLDSLSDYAVVAEWIFAALVIVGVVGEFVIAAKHPPYDSRLGQWGPAIGDFLVALGVAGEVGAGALAHIYQNELTRRSNDRLADAQTRAANAERETERIKAITAWRHISSEAENEVASALYDLAPHIELLIEFQNGDPESFAYACEFIRVFAKAGVPKSKIRYCGNFLMAVPVFGVLITSSDEAIIGPVLSTFSEASIPLIRAGGNSSGYLPSGVTAPNLRIFVAPKPPPTSDIPATFINPLEGIVRRN